MNAITTAPADSRLLISGNEAVARAAWEAGVKVASAYPGTPSTEILESLATYPDLVAQWAPNEKVSLEVAIGSSLVGGRAFCAMKHVGMNVAADALMSQTLAGINAGLVIAVADDVGLSSSQNEQDSRFWGRFGHLPILEPGDSQEAYAFTKAAFEISERFETPVILRLTTRVCHVKSLVTVGERAEPEHKGFRFDKRWVLVPSTAKARLPLQAERDAAMAAFSDDCELNLLMDGGDTSIGFISSGPAAFNVREAFPDAPVLKLGMSYPLPMAKIKALAEKVDTLVVVEETEPLVETDLKAAGIAVIGKEVMPRVHELSTAVVRNGIARLKGEAPSPLPGPDAEVFPRPPTMCVGCPHLSPFYVLSKLRKKVLISGDIGCYTLGTGHPWNAIDTTTCMGASLSMADGMVKAKGGADADRAVVAVIGDSTFLHMGMQGLVNLTYNGGSNVTVLLLDNRAVGMTGGQENPGTGRDIHGNETTRVDFKKLVEALGVKPERITEIDPYDLPGLNKAVKREIAVDDVSVIITNRPCVLTPRHAPTEALKVIEEDCIGCSNCLRVGCPAIVVTRRETETAPSGRVREMAFVTIESEFCTGCGTCLPTCGPNVIVPVSEPATPKQEG